MCGSCASEIPFDISGIRSIIQVTVLRGGGLRAAGCCRMITSGGLFCSKSRYCLYAEAVPAAGIGPDFHAMIYIGRRKLLSLAIYAVIASSCDSVIASVSFRFIVGKCCSSNSFGSLAFSLTFCASELSCRLMYSNVSASDRNSLGCL